MLIDTTLAMPSDMGGLGVRGERTTGNLNRTTVPCCDADPFVVGDPFARAKGAQLGALRGGGSACGGVPPGCVMQNRDNHTRVRADILGGSRTPHTRVCPNIWSHRTHRGPRPSRWPIRIVREMDKCTRGVIGGPCALVTVWVHLTILMPH